MNAKNRLILIIICLILAFLVFLARHFKNESYTVESSIELDIVAKVTSKDIL